jgi:gluconate kinase
MVKSQFAALEPPTDALTIDARQSPEKIIAEIRQAQAL